MSAPSPRLGVAHPTVVPTTCRSSRPDGDDDRAETDAPADDDSTADAPADPAAGDR